MILYMYIFCMSCVVSILNLYISCVPISDKFTEQYWFDKRDLQNIGEKIKGIKLIQDESSVGIIGHLPEIRRYLQRGLLEGGVRRRKYLENRNDDGSTHFETASPPTEQLSVKSDTSEYVTNFVINVGDGRSDWKFKKKDSIHKRQVPDDGRVSEEVEFLRSNQPNKVKNNKKREISTGKEEGSRKQENRKCEFGDDDCEEYDELIDDDFDDDDEDDDDDTNTINTNISITNDTNNKICVTILYPNSKGDVSLSQLRSQSDSDSDENENEDVEEKSEKCTTESGFNEGAGSSKTPKHPPKNKINVIFKTTISILAIWIVGICAVVCFLTCGCFYIYVEYFAKDHLTKAPTSMPIHDEPSDAQISQTD